MDLVDLPVDLITVDLIFIDLMDLAVLGSAGGLALGRATEHLADVGLTVGLAAVGFGRYGSIHCGFR